MKEKEGPDDSFIGTLLLVFLIGGMSLLQTCQSKREWCKEIDRDQRSGLALTDKEKEQLEDCGDVR